MKEYKEVLPGDGIEKLKYYEEQLNELAKQGFKVVAVISASYVCDSRIILERDIPADGSYTKPKKPICR